MAWAYLLREAQCTSCAKSTQLPGCPPAWLHPASPRQWGTWFIPLKNLTLRPFVPDQVLKGERHVQRSL